MRYQNLDALRGIAALTVMVQHLCGHVWRATPDGQNSWLKFLSVDYFDWGRFGVTLFFLISGFVIPISFSGPTPIKKFVVSRIFRLYPAFWLSVFATTALIYLDSQVCFYQVFANLTMIYPLFRQPAIQGVYWTLIVELIFYMACFVLFISKSLNQPVVLCAVGIVAIFSAVVPLALRIFWLVPIPISLLGYHLSFLLLGSLIREVLASTHRARSMTLLLGAAIIVTLPIVSGAFGVTDAVIYSLATPIGAMLSVVAGIALFLLYWAPYFERQKTILLSLGAWSYSIYLFHEPVASVLHKLVGINNMSQGVFFVVSVSAFAIIASWAVYSYVERPSILFGQRIVQGGSATRKVAS